MDARCRMPSGKIRPGDVWEHPQREMAAGKLLEIPACVIPLKPGKSTGRQAGATKFRLKCCRWRATARQFRFKKGGGMWSEIGHARFGALKIVREFLLIWSTLSSATKQITRTSGSKSGDGGCSLTVPSHGALKTCRWDVLPRLGKEPLSSKVEDGKITDETNGICKYRVCASRNAPPWTSPAHHVESSGGYPSVLAPKDFHQERAGCFRWTCAGDDDQERRRLDAKPPQGILRRLCVWAASRSRRREAASRLVPKWLDGKSLRFVASKSSSRPFHSHLRSPPPVHPSLWPLLPLHSLLCPSQSTLPPIVSQRDSPPAICSLARPPDSPSALLGHPPRQPFRPSPQHSTRHFLPLLVLKPSEEPPG